MALQSEKQSRVERFFAHHRLDKLYLAMDKNLYISSLRHGLSLSIPFFLFGSFALVLLNLPIPYYQNLIQTVLGGVLPRIFLCLFNATMGILSLVMLVSVSYSFGKLADPGKSGAYPLTCLTSYFVFVLGPGGTISLEKFGSDWLFTAVIITLSCCAILRKLLAIAQRRHDKHYHEGIDLDFQNVMVSLMPTAACVSVFVLIKLAAILFLGSTDLQNVGADIFMALFQKVGNGLGGSILFIVLTHILWFFGIHGSNMLGMVAEDLFESGMAVNMAAAEAGIAPTVLFTKTFFDCFVLMGGCGATLGLLLALSLGNRRSSSRSLVRYALIPGIFNINELVLFGLPVVFNPIMLIPYILVPVVILCTSALAMVLGIVPICSQQVAWTSPIIYSGIASTGSWTGAVLQIINLLIAASIYLPFIKLSDQYYSTFLKQTVSTLQKTIQDREETGNTTSLHTPEYRDLQDVIKLMTEDLRHALHSQKVGLYYQPQFNRDGTLHGLEALLRWNHPSLGFQYPPMVMELAREDGILQEMGYQIIETASRTLERLSQEVRYPIVMAVNISPEQLENASFCDTVQQILQRHNFRGSRLCFEVTEQIALSSTDLVRKRIRRLHDMGISFHMDDFGMGHSSMTYLQEEVFDTVKLDGALIRDADKNARTRDIITGITSMSDSLHYKVIAEYVETVEQRDLLCSLGCTIYQGYLYSPALELSRLEVFLLEHGVIRNLAKEKPSAQELYL